MPFLDAKALEHDPAGMAFLKAVLRPDAGAQPHAGAELLQAGVRDIAMPRAGLDAPPCAAGAAVAPEAPLAPTRPRLELVSGDGEPVPA